MANRSMSARRPLVIADAFCGAGGSSEGMRRAFTARGVPAQLIAINHWPTAITTHTANHPDAVHHCVDLTKTRLGELVPNGRVDAIWLSPSCTTFSYAQGGKSIDENARWRLGDDGVRRTLSTEANHRRKRTTVCQLGTSRRPRATNQEPPWRHISRVAGEH